VDVICSLPVDKVGEDCKEYSLTYSSFGEYWVSFNVDNGAFHQGAKDSTESGIVDLLVIDFVLGYILDEPIYLLFTSLIILLKEVVKPLLTSFIICTSLMRHNIHQIISWICLQTT
jgi:hypothetical protein